MFVFYQKSLFRAALLIFLIVAAVNLIQTAIVRTARAVIMVMSGRLVPIYSVGTDEKKVALSLDAVWGSDYTEGILELLRKYNIKTTFFLGGFWLEKYPELVKKIASEGHEIGNHTYSHPHLNSLSREEIRNELLKTHDMIKTLTGKDAKVFRPPFGEYSNKVIEVAKECGYETIIWSIDSLDWQDLSAQEMVSRVMGKMHNGAIVLFHNNGTHTLEALNIIIPELSRQGYKIVPVSELIYKDNYYIHPHTGEQRRIERGKRIPEGGKRNGRKKPGAAA